MHMVGMHMPIHAYGDYAQVDMHMVGMHMHGYMDAWLVHLEYQFTWRGPNLGPTHIGRDLLEWY